MDVERSANPFAKLTYKTSQNLGKNNDLLIVTNLLTSLRYVVRLLTLILVLAVA